MSVDVNTSQIIGAQNDWSADFIAAKVVQPNMTDLSPTPDVFGQLPIFKDIKITMGGAMKKAEVASGRAYNYEGVIEPVIETTWLQRDIKTFMLAWSQLPGVNGGLAPTLVLVVGLSRVDVTGQGLATRDYLLAGPCKLEPLSELTLMGNTIKAKFLVQPCSAAYTGLTSADATALAALPTPPATTLSATNLALGAYGYMTLHAY